MPPALEATDSHTRQNKGSIEAFQVFPNDEADLKIVTVHLSDVNNEDLYPNRIVTLQHPTWTAIIGRGNISDEAILPSPTNCWFTSKVMSRQHATLTADPVNMVVTLRDTSSMHGTFLNGDRIGRQEMDLLPGDIVTFGTDIVRQAESFSPLKMLVAYEWSEATPLPSTPEIRKNTFSADYSEDDVQSDFDDDVEIVHESIRLPSVEILPTGFDFSTRLAQHTSSLLSSSKTPASKTTSATSPPSSTSGSALQENNKGRTQPGASLISPVYVADETDSDSESEDFPSHQNEEVTIPDTSGSVSDADTSDNEAEDEDEDKDEENLTDQDENVDTTDILNVENAKLDGKMVESQSGLAAASDKLQRQPSPSDAALAKSAPMEPKPISHPPFPPPSFFSQSSFLPFGSPYPNPPPFPSSGWVGTNEHFGSPPSPAVWENSFTDSLPQQTYPFASDINMVVDQMQPAANLSQQSEHEASPFKLPPKRKFDALRESESICMSPPHASRSIAPDWPANGSAYTLAIPPLQLTPLKESVPTLLSTKQVVTLENDVESLPSRKLMQTRSKSTITMLKSANTVVEPVDGENAEPARKKLKAKEASRSAQGSTASTFAKYAATAIAGASVGAIGVVFGLAALPQDYFT